MAKFVRLESGTYINIDKIVLIEKAHYEHVFNNNEKDNNDKDNNDYTITLLGADENIHVTITKTDVDNILKITGN